MKLGKEEDLETALHIWFNQKIFDVVPVPGPMLCAKAVQFFEKEGKG